jgi:hypothetical protein
MDIRIIQQPTSPQRQDRCGLRAIGIRTVAIGVSARDVGNGHRVPAPFTGGGIGATGMSGIAANGDNASLP